MHLVNEAGHRQDGVQLVKEKAEWEATVNRQGLKNKKNIGRHRLADSHDSKLNAHTLASS